MGLGNDQSPMRLAVRQHPALIKKFEHKLQSIAWIVAELSEKLEAWDECI